MNCSGCQAANPQSAKFCGACGARLELACPACGVPNPAANRFCHECGTGLDPAAAAASPERYTPKHLAERILTSRAALEGERKQVTVLFADLKGSMELIAERDPEAARKLLDPVLEHMMEAVHRFEGTVNQVMGDGIMALFGAPLAHEDHAQRACFAALRMLESVGRYADQVQRSEGVPLTIRVGLNSGEVVVRAISNDLRMDYSAVGHTTHLASRLEQMAKPGTALVSADTLRLAENYVQVRALGTVSVRGLEAPVEVYELTGAMAGRSRLQAAAVRGLTRFVGREAEVAQLHAAEEKARGGHGQAVAVVGEPGVGKSRLFWEFLRSQRAQNWLALQSTSVSYGKATAYRPVIDLLKGYFQIEARDDVRSMREKVTGRLLNLDRSLEPALPPLLALLDLPVDDAAWLALDPTLRRSRTLESCKRLLLREAQEQPLLLVFEDLQWIDSETQALLDSLVESLPSARVLLLVNYRPEYEHGWSGRTCYTQLRLDALPPAGAEALLVALVGADPALAPLKQTLIARTEGNPFFIEECVRTLVETGTLSGPPGAYGVTRALPEVQVPATVQAVLAARIDRLAGEDKRLLQTAAVIGKDLSLAVLRAIAELPEDELRAGLARLQAHEFVYETTLFPEPEYTFKHALTHEVAYGSLLQERRRGLHARIVEALEREHAGRLEEHVEQLGQHAYRGEVWDKAVTYLRHAGTKAVARSASREALELFEHALSALARLPQSLDTLSMELDLRIASSAPLIAMEGGSAPAVEAAYRKARELCERLGDTKRLFPVLWGTWYVRFSRGQTDAAHEISQTLFDLGQQSGDPAVLLEAHHTMWTTLSQAGKWVAAREHLERGFALYDRRQHGSLADVYGAHDPGVCCKAFLAGGYWAAGYPDQGLAHALEGLALAREVARNANLTTVLALHRAALLHYLRGEMEPAITFTQAISEHADPRPHRSYTFDAAILLARLTVDREGGLERVERSASAFPRDRQGGGYWRDIACLLLLAEAFGEAGRPEAGLALLREPIENAFAGYWAPEVHRLYGALCLQARRSDTEAERWLRQARDMASVRQERMFELRAARDLARMLAGAGERTRAREELQPVFDRFSEGLQTRDLVQARELLASL